MENKINIAEILCDMPKGTKLYSPIFGDVKLKEIASIEKRSEYPITVTAIMSKVNGDVNFTENGLYISEYAISEPTLFPSRNMRDWTKFFKRGDVVTNKVTGTIAIFESWKDDDYTEFYTAIKYRSDCTFGIEEVCLTELYSKVSDEQRAEFIAKAEKHYNGKYNPETLQIESVESVEPVKPKSEFKPFDKVLVRDSEDQVWHANYFSHYNGKEKELPYACIAGWFRQCIPYEGNEHLLGTKDNYNI